MKVLSFAVFVLALMVIVGWLFDIEQLKSIMPKYVSMKFNTALCFILMSISLTIEAFRLRKFIFISIIINAFVAVFSLLTYSQEIFGYNLHIDQFFIIDEVGIQAKEAFPGRMSPITVFLFSMLSISLILDKCIKRKYLFILQYIYHIVTLMAIIAIIGYIYNAPEFYTLSFLTSMAVHTAIGFLLLSVGTALIHPSLGVTGILIGNSVGNSVARKLFSQICIAIMAFTYIRYLTHKYNIVDIEFGIALLTISFLIISLVIIWEAADKLNKKDEKKKLAEEHFRLVVESAPNALIMSDSKGTITLVNKQAEIMFGYEREELIGKKIELLVPNKFTPNHDKNRVSYHASPKAKYFGAGRDLYAVRSTGEEFPVEIGLNPIRKEDGKIAVLASIIDITERKKQEAIIRKQVIELKLKNQEMEQFNYIASHDLQEPLRTVSNYIMLLNEDYEEELNADIKMHLVTMDDAIKRMSLLVRSLLDFGRLGRDKKLVKSDCGKIAENVLKDLSNLICETNAKVKIEGQLPLTNVYEIEFRQLLQNLINNAIKFRKADVPAEIVIGCTSTASQHEFYVTDNGIGIKEKYADKIFQIFQRLNKNTEYEGHGIGLANCRKIAEMHGGKIWVESIPGEGSTFKFTILNLKDESTIKLHHAS
ncbi:hypothetical protein GCM10007424_21410 [Flavobacterium suaedae]|uniref:histidine kinase n=1 Tax=Flavobacterium suaedae TaxID=1767027 RepID=A0ABQ1JX77_9FLAO|nr:PAS domain-containing sensor histidine kinase [Flavobacterium suaedae]GGB81029.1 hypothetical protein GCM10007424_21410 [Flavobacterium suaedae]